MDRHSSIPCCNQFIPIHHYTPRLNFCMETKQMIESVNPQISMAVNKDFIHSIDKTHRFHSNNVSSFPTINRHLSMPSYDQHQFEEDHSLRIHVGNIPFLWTIDDLCKQFLVFGLIKDPEIVSNERGSKGFGFITFLRHSDGINAIRVKNGSIADGRKITVALASSRSSNRINSCCCVKQ